MFLNRGKSHDAAGPAANVEHNRILHEHVVVLAIETMPEPYVDPATASSSTTSGTTTTGSST